MQEAVGAIQGIVGRIERISGISNAIAAAVEQQGVATARISQNARHTAVNAQEMTVNIAGVSQAANDTGAAAREVLASAGILARQAEQLKTDVGSFVRAVQAG